MSRGFYSVDYNLEYTPAPTIRPYSSGSVARSFSARINEKLLRAFSTCIGQLVAHVFVCCMVVACFINISRTAVAVLFEALFLGVRTMEPNNPHNNITALEPSTSSTSLPEQDQEDQTSGS